MTITINGSGTITGATTLASTVASPTMSSATLTTPTLTTPTMSGAIVSAMGSSVITTGTVNAGGTNPFPSSGGPTAVDFTGIPSWVKRITCMFSLVSTNGTVSPMIQVGTSGGVVTTGYNAMAGLVTTTSNTTRGLGYTTGFGVTWAGGATAYLYSGTVVLSNFGSSNIWVASGVVNNTNQEIDISGGQITLSGTLDRVRFTAANFTDAFDSGSVNIYYE